MTDENSLEFLPSNFFSQETAIAQSNKKLPEGILKKELSLDKIGQLC